MSGLVSKKTYLSSRLHMAGLHATLETPCCIMFRSDLKCCHVTWEHSKHFLSSPVRRQKGSKLGYTGVSLTHAMFLVPVKEREIEVRVGFMFIIYVSIWAVREIQGGGGFFQINSMCTKAMKFLVPWDFVSTTPLPHLVPLELLSDSISKQWQTPLCVTIFDDDVSKPSEKNINIFRQRCHHLDYSSQWMFILLILLTCCNAIQRTPKEVYVSLRFSQDTLWRNKSSSPASNYLYGPQHWRKQEKGSIGVRIKIREHGLNTGGKLFVGLPDFLCMFVFS